MLRQRSNESGKLNRLRALAVATAAAIICITLPNMLSAKTIASFENPAEFRNWGVVNDTVMGGNSQSVFERTSDGNLFFTGELSLANNGGFVSIRNRPQALGLGASTGIELRVRGDGRDYYLDLRSSRQRMAGSFRASFTTAENEWKEIFIPLTNFVAQSFGRALPNERLNPASITSIGFTLSDKQPGPFQLEVAYVKSVEDETLTETGTTADVVEQQLRLIELAISRGVPLFNEGNPAACAAIYEVTCTALAAMPETPAAAAATLRRALKEIETTESDSEKAWILRYALDDALAVLR